MKKIFLHFLFFLSTLSAPSAFAQSIIDVHAHIGSFRGFEIGEKVLIANLKKSGIKMALVSNIDGAALPGTTANLNEEKANRETVEAVKRNPSLLRGLLWARPVDGDVKNLQPFLKETLANGERLFVGVKFHPDMNQFPADSPKLDPYLKFCDENHLVAVFHSGPEGENSAPSKIYAAAKRFPKLPVVLYHMGFGGAHKEAIAAAKSAKKKGDAQLYLETAQASPTAVVEAVKELGADKVLFGTDATYYGVDHYKKYNPLFRTLRQSLTPNDLDLVFAGNAKRLFQLK